jgi:DNA-binding MarR family transcriptional regulator
MTIDEELVERAVRTYGDMLALAEPVRFRLWDSRGLTMTQLRLMFTLFQQDGIAVSTLAQRMDISPSAMTGIIDRLRKSKLIRRRADPRDRRVTRIYLTEEGRTLWREVDAAGHAYVSATVRRLGRDKVEAFIAALSEFLEAAKGAQEVKSDTPVSTVAEFIKPNVAEA